MKQSYTETVIRIDERLKAFIESNNEQHKEILTKIMGNRKEIDNLCTHVNDENIKMDKRVSNLEDKENARKVQWKTLLVVGGGSAALTTFIIQLLQALNII